MAVPPVEVRGTWEGTDLTTGVLGAKADLEALGDAAGTAATDINTSLSSVSDQATTTFGTDLPASTDAAAFDLTTKATKFKAVGTELGTQVAQGVASGVDPATSAVDVGTSLTGLLAASAKTGVGAAALVGIGLGVALVKNMMKAAEEEAQALRDTVNALLGAVENDFKGSMRSIVQDMRSELSVINVITQLGEGDLGAGWAELERVSNATGENVNVLVDYLQGKATPAAMRLADEFGRGRDLVQSGESIIGDTNQTLAVQYGVAKKLVEEADKNTRAWQVAKDTAAGLKDLMSGTADETERAAAAAERFAAGLGSASRQQGNQDYGI